MAAENYVLLERIELNASAASVEFTNIPQSGYTDLKVVVSCRMARATNGGALNVNFNGSSANLTERNMWGNGTSAVSGTDVALVALVPGANTTASTFSNFELYVPNYTSSNFKSWSVDFTSENNATAGYDGFVAGLWSQTTAINAIKFIDNGADNLVQYSTFSLYGLAAVGTTPAIAPKASGGNIDYDGTYWIHTFLTSGTFTPQTGLSCDYLVVAGGGGGGCSYGGGGGAGGLRSTVTATGGGGTVETALSLGTSAYTVTIGAGGSGGTNGAVSTNGANSVFSTITSTGGGKGADNGGAGFTSGATGGSGGGANYTNTTGGSGTANQGYAAGNGNASIAAGSGGGGAGASSATVTTSGVATNGGAGVATSINGSSVTYAGGGGGGATIGGGAGTTAGTGGTGGGGAGSKDVGGSGTSGTTNTGGGGGGSGYFNTTGAGGNGGSGIVIIRYLAA